jgi:hypothetical protein
MGTGGQAGGTAGNSGTGGVGGNSGTGGTGGTAAAVLRPLINAFCAAAWNCCGRASYPTADLNDCRSNFPSRFRYYPMVDKGTVTVAQTALNTCVAAYDTAATTCSMTPLHAACRGIFAGTQGEGQSCGGTGEFGAFECKPVNGASSCYWADSGGYPTTAGVCISLPRGKSGDECSRTCLKNQDCVADMLGRSAPFPVMCFEEDGLYCSIRTNPAVCKPIVQIGDACTWDTGSCGSGNFCSWTNDTCRPAAKLGESCQNVACVTDLTCGTTLRCIEEPFTSESTCKGTPSVP